MRLPKRSRAGATFFVLLALTLVWTATPCVEARPRVRSEVRPRVAKKSFRYLGPDTTMRRRPGTNTHPTAPPLIPLPPVRQHSAAACGLASLQSVLAYYGAPSRRASQLVASAQQGRRADRYSYEAGTPETMMVKLARDAGLKIKTSHRMSLSELARNVNSGKPVTVGIQAWVKKPERVDWRKVQDAGHYVVAIGIGDAKGKPITNTKGLARRKDAYVWFMDPAADLGNRGYIPVQEFMQRWHWSSDKGKPARFGMVLSSSAPPAQRAFVSGIERIK